MTQKELSYLEDAIGHIENIIKICNESINNLQDESLISFLNQEVENHTSLKEELMDKLEEKANEWSTNNG